MNLRKLNTTRTVTGASGKMYKFNMYAMDVNDLAELCSNFKEGACGIYIFSNRYKDKMTGNFKHKPIYCGQSATLDKRFNNHKDEIINKHNANCISLHACVERYLDHIEKDILLANNFPCNIQHNS